jgi:hypothetical protein
MFFDTRRLGRLARRDTLSRLRQLLQYTITSMSRRTSTLAMTF